MSGRLAEDCLLDNFDLSKRCFWMYSRVETLSSKTVWYWGETNPIFGLKTSATSKYWTGEKPKLTPICDLGSHLGIYPTPDCWRKSRTKTGHPHVWKIYRFISDGSLAFRLTGVYPIVSRVSLLCISEVYLRANDQKERDIASGHIFISWRIFARAMLVRVRVWC